MFADSDAGWHIVVGEQILASRQVPHSDFGSFLNTGRPWYAWEWAAEILMVLFHRWQGLTGVVFLFTLSIGAAFWLCFRLHRRLGGDFFLACIMASPLVATAQIHWLARPHVLSYLLLLGAMFYLEAAPERFRLRDAAVLALGTALWAGIHGSFPLAIALPLLYGAGHAARAVLWPKLDASREWRQARWFLLAALCAAVGSLLNPYGLELHRHIWQFSLGAEARAHISEWRPFDFGATGTGQVLIAAALGGVGALMALGQRDLPHFLVAGFLVVLGLGSARGLPLVALVALPMANAAITRALQRVKGLDWLMRVSAELRTLDRGHHGAALVPLAVLAALFWLRQPEVAAETGFSPETYPVQAAEAIAGLPASSRIFASSRVGGYLEYRFDGRRKIWIDGRMDYFGTEPYLQYEQIALGQPGWQATLEQVGFTHAVVESSLPEARTLARAGWRQIYSDPRFTVLERPFP